jgi:hypothetical protein
MSINIITKGRSSIHKTSSKHDDDQGPLSSSISFDRVLLNTVAADGDDARDDDSNTSGSE